MMSKFHIGGRSGVWLAHPSNRSDRPAHRSAFADFSLLSLTHMTSFFYMHRFQAARFLLTCGHSMSEADGVDGFISSR